VKSSVFGEGDARFVGALPAPDVCVVVPVNESPDPLDDLYREYSESLLAEGISCEFLFIAVPEHLPHTRVLFELSRAGAPVRVFGVGQSSVGRSLLSAAVDRCHSPIVLTLPPVRRVAAHAIPQLVRRVQQGADLAVARRWPRTDPWWNRVQTRFLHATIGWLLPGKLRDVSSGVAAMRCEVIGELRLQGDLDRFLPLLAERDGYHVEEVDSPQHPMDHRARLHGPRIYLRRLLDLFSLYFLVRFTEKPLRFFGLVGMASGFMGSLILFVLLIQRLQGQPVSDRPIVLLGVLGVVLGVQLIGLGLIGEIIVHHRAPSRRPYRLRSDDPFLPGRETDSGAGEVSRSSVPASLPESQNQPAP